MDNDTISSPGHFSDRTFFVTPAVKRFSSLLSVINIDSLIVCLQMTHLLFILLLCSGKLPLRCAAKISVYSKNCGLPFLTDRSGSNAQSFIFYNYNLTNRLSNIVTAPQLHATEEPSLRQFRSQTTYPFLSGIWQFQSLFPFYRLNGLSFLHAFRLSFPHLPV